MLSMSARELDPAHRARDDLAAAGSSAALGHPFELALVDDRDTELLDLVELAASVLAGEHIVGHLRHRPGDLAAALLDQRLGLGARTLRHGAGQDERHTRERQLATAGLHGPGKLPQALGIEVVQPLGPEESHDLLSGTAFHQIGDQIARPCRIVAVGRSTIHLEVRWPRES